MHIYTPITGKIRAFITRVAISEVYVASIHCALHGM